MIARLQAVRELIKAYSVGVTTAELDQLFALFAAYQLIKTEEKRRFERSAIVKTLTEKFGEKNPDVSTFFYQRSYT